MSLPTEGRAVTFESGSQWRKWDLHVHTPASHFHRYGQDAEAWERFIDDLEQLPSEFAVLGINDYLFLDGYKRLLEEKSNGRLANIECLLPVVELRLNRFGGSNNKLSKVNYHVLFSDEIPVEEIEKQFIQSMSREVQIGVDGQSWNAAPSKESLTELGAMIKASVPAGEKSKFADDLTEGFNAFTVELPEVRKLLTRHVFAGKNLTAVGKTEWSDLKWNDHSIADKKDIINGCDVVFIASEGSTAFRKAQRSLADQEVRSTLFDCSDAHSYSSAEDKDRIGNCMTWVNADPTFEGLRHALIEYERRVFVGESPEKLQALRERPGQHLRSVVTRPLPSKPPALFGPDFDLPLNPGLVAIIGKKGMGKSAVVDILGLLGDSPNSSSFSFLSGERFREPKENPAQYYEAESTWLGGSTSTRRLDDVVGGVSREQVRYLPQSLLEEICAADGSDAANRFEHELGTVIFSHVPPEERLGATTLDELLEERSAGIRRRLASLRSEVSLSNEKIVGMEGQLASGRLAATKERLEARRGDLASHDANKPAEPSIESSGSNEAADAIAALIAERDSIRSAIEQRSAETRSLAKKTADIGSLTELLDGLERHVSAVRLQIEPLAEMLDIDSEELLSLTINRELLGAVSQDAEVERLDFNSDPSTERLQEIEDQVAELQDQLDEPRRRQEKYRRDLEGWELLRQRIIGDEDADGSITFLERIKSEMDAMPGHLQGARSRRLELCREIHLQLVRLTEVYRLVHEPVQRFIDDHPLAQNQFDLSFEVDLATEGFADQFFGMVDRAVVGSFRGRDEGATVLDGLISSTNFNETDDALEFLADVHDRLHTDFRDAQQEPRDVRTQLRKGYDPKTLYDLVFSMEYLDPQYRLQSGGASISRLSPGEKGTLLLMFYLLVDRGTMPLLLDQPEENLDNETIHELLVPAMQEAASRRQIVLVTHNPNLAVVGDADQVVVAGAGGQRFSYLSGSIENPKVNAALVQVLEGSWPAFNNRRKKYVAPSRS